MTMTLKKSHVMVYIVYFIILLKLVVVNVVTAQEETDSPIPSSDENGCGETGACIKVNDTLKFCDGLLKDPPDNGTYKPKGVLGKCMCNQEYYDSLNTCLECFVDETSLEYHVAPLEEYKKECKTLEIPFAQNAPTTPQTKIPATIKLGLAAGIVVVLLCLFGIIALQYFRRKKKKDAGSKPPKSKVTDEKYEKYSSPDTSSAHYPSTFYPPPPSDIHSPSPQSTTPYYPPPSSEYSGEYPPPQQPPPHGSQGGQADSYFRGDF